MALYRRYERVAGILLGYIRTTDGAQIPLDEQNIDYRAVLEWIEDGNTPDAAILPPAPPPAPDFANDVDAEMTFWESAPARVTALRAYIAADTPTAAQTVAVVKLLCRIALFFIRRWFPRE